MKDQILRIIKLSAVFTIALSLVSLQGPLSSDFHLPGLELAHAFVECGRACNGYLSGTYFSHFWIPAGPSMDTEVALIFTDETAEFTDLQSSSPSIDFVDSPVPPNLVNNFTSSNNIGITSEVVGADYYEIEFMQANNFWGCNFSFGNSTCGVQIRQGIWHMIDTANFASKDPSLAGHAFASDAPVPADNLGGLPTVNPCAWDSSFPESGSNCVLGAPGGTAYRLSNAAGADGFPWLQAPGSPDLDAAAQHFVNAGIATGFNATTSVLTGISSAAISHPPLFLHYSGDNIAQIDLHNGLSAQLCYLFTGSYSEPCSYMTSFVAGPLTVFPGYTTSTTGVNLTWGMYLAHFESPKGPSAFDQSLYFQYNSRFVSGVPSILPPNGPCSSSAGPTARAPDYMYICNPTYDNVTSQIESASSFSSAIGLGERAEDLFGRNAYTIPVFQQNTASAYLGGWIRDINNAGIGAPNYFTWLDAWNPNPVQPGTIRQGFRQTTMSVNPFIASTVQDKQIVGNIYDSPTVMNPVGSGGLIDWMVLSVQQLSNGLLTYVPPAGTTQTFRLTLRSDLFFQDGRRVTAFDAAFSYLALKGTGAASGGGAAPVSGITILGPSQFDINLNYVGPFTQLSLFALPILPGAYWTNAGLSAWTQGIASCTATGAVCYPSQYTLGSPSTTTVCALLCVFPASLMNVNIAQTGASYDPIANHVLIGSGPWECGQGANLGYGCSTTGSQNPPVGGSYTLTRFGKGLPPGSSISSIYFRSNGNLALYLWSLDTGVFTNDFLEFSLVTRCFGAPVTSTGPCAHFQQGIGANGGPIPVGLAQVAIVNRFVGLNWVAPFNWFTSPPAGTIPLNPVLYENTITLNPASAVGCTTAYPIGGYDC